MRDTRRDQLIEFVEKEFIGPDPIDWPGLTQNNGEEILTTDPPRTRYIAGILYPRETKDTDVDTREGESEPLGDLEGEDPGVDEDKRYGSDNVEFLENAEELINRSNAFRQSAISLTLCAGKTDSIHTEVTAGIYSTITVTDPKTGKKTTTYPRTGISWNNDGQSLSMPTNENRIIKLPVDSTGLQLDITYRYSISGNVIYTVTLENTKEKTGEAVRDEDCFFQTKVRLFSESGFVPLVDGQRITEDEDYQSNQLLYRNVHNYAIGHGCAADWDDDVTVKWISSATFPRYDIKPIVPCTIDGVSLEMYKMSPYGDFAETLAELRLMCRKYSDWIDELQVMRNDLEDRYSITADRHINNCKACLNRMEKGVTLLEQEETIRVAFQYMNLAMLMQQLHYNLPLQYWEEDGSSGIRLINPVAMPVVNDRETW